MSSSVLVLEIYYQVQFCFPWHIEMEYYQPLFICSVLELAHLCERLCRTSQFILTFRASPVTFLLMHMGTFWLTLDGSRQLALTATFMNASCFHNENISYSGILLLSELAWIAGIGLPHNRAK